MSEQVVEIYTDGGCRGNPGIGAWGVLLRFNGTEKQLSGSERETTNNRMELTAAIKGLESLTRDCQVRLTTDSQYVQKGITEWISGWKARGWKTAAKKPVKNMDLWKQLDQLVVDHQIEWHWVRGHSGHAENELVDQLCNEAMDRMEPS